MDEVRALIAANVITNEQNGCLHRTVEDYMEDFENSMFQLEARMNADLATWNQQERDIKRVK